MAQQHVALSIDGAVARLRLANPPGRNAINLQFCREFAAAAAAVEAAAGVAVVLVTGEGGVFSVGGDIREFVAEKARAEAHVRAMTAALHDGIVRLQRTAAPVLAAVGGVAAGAGFSLVCGADLVLAGNSARFTSAYTNSGLTPDGGGTWFLPRIVGLRRAFELMALNPVLSAEEAKTLGIVTRVVADDALADAAEAMAAQLAAMPPGGLAGLKRLLRSSREAGLTDQLDAEADSISRLVATPSTMARLEAFLARR
jgi:2-(1,2-epoxy-1,2-dihydrophenyl)acetyl-CoA isomerase